MKNPNRCQEDVEVLHGRVSRGRSCLFRVVDESNFDKEVYARLSKEVQYNLQNRRIQNHEHFEVWFYGVFKSSVGLQLDYELVL